MGVKSLLFLLLAAASLEPLRGAEIIAPASVEARLDAKRTGPGGATVLLFLAHDCPISNALVPEMNRIANEYGAQGAKFFFIYAERDLTDLAAARHARDFALSAPVAVDRAGLLSARAGAKVTPEAAVFSRSGVVVYRGRINDLFAGYRQKRAEPTSHDLRLALDAVLAGKAPPVSTTPAIGCFIPTKP